MSEQIVGKIIKVIGPVVDVEFQLKITSIKNALFVSNPGISNEADNLVIEVAQHLVITLVVVLPWMQLMVWYAVWKLAIPASRSPFLLELRHLVES